MGKLVKSDKKPDDFKGRDPVYRVHLDFYDPTQNNNKFWYIEVYAPEPPEANYSVVRRWGRNGTQGQSMVEVASMKGAAIEYAEKLAEKKKDEGYKPDPSLLVKIAREVGDDA